MITQSHLRIRVPYERAGEYRRPSIRRMPLTKAEREAARQACIVPPARWSEAGLQYMPERPAPVIRVTGELLNAKPGQLCAQVRPATPAALPTVPRPVAAEDVPAQTVPRVPTKRQPRGTLGDLARATLERFRARYALAEEIPA